MRYTDIWLVETTADINKSIDIIKTGMLSLQKMVIDYPGMSDAIYKRLVNLADWVQEQYDKVEAEFPSPGGGPTGDQMTLFNSAKLSEDIDIDNAIDNINDNLDAIATIDCNTVQPQVCINYGEIVQGVATGINDITDEVEGHLKSVKFSYDVEKQQQKIDAELINKVAGKITGELAKIKEHYVQQVIELRKDKLKPTDSERLAAMKKKLELGKITDEITTILQGWLKRYRDTLDSAAEVEDINAIIHKFLKASVEGVIPLEILLNAGSGDILDHVPSEYNKLIEKPADGGPLGGFIPGLLGLKPSGSGAGAWGPGELGLALLGTPVNKSATKGDLVVAGEKFELKASADPKSGGRINTDAVMGGTGGRTDFNAAWNDFIARVPITFNDNKISWDKTLPKLKKNASEHDIWAKNRQTVMHKKYRPAGSQGSIGHTTVGPNWIGIINEALANYKTKKGPGNFDSNKALRKHLEKFLTAVLLAPINKDYKSRARYDMAKIIFTDAEFKKPYIDAHGFLGEYTRQLLEFYKETDNVGRILIINPIDSHFEVVSADNPEELMDKIKSGAIQVGTTYIGFNDKQSKATPQYGTART